MALDPDDCPHFHKTTIGQGPPLGPWWLACYDCESKWPVALAFQHNARLPLGFRRVVTTPTVPTVYGLLTEDGLFRLTLETGEVLLLESQV